MASTYSVLAEPARRGILDLLRDQPRSVGELVELLGLTQPGTSKHLRVLREAGLVSVRRQAQRRMYELRPQPLAEVDAWLAPYRQLWSDSLDALEAHLDTMAGGAGAAGVAGVGGACVGAAGVGVPDETAVTGGVGAGGVDVDARQAPSERVGHDG